MDVCTKFDVNPSNSGGIKSEPTHDISIYTAMQLLKIT